MPRFTRVGAFLVLVATLVLAPSFAARAASSNWSGDQRASVRIITATNGVPGSTLQIGVEFRYPNGWHGYWRTPGDAGIAPIFDWSRSRNVASASVSWPAPSRLVISGLQNSVYTGDLILPVSLKLDHPHEATRIALTLDYASCANVCVPEHAEVALTLPPGMDGPSSEAADIAAAAQRVPQTPTEAGIGVVHSTLEQTSAGRRLKVDLRSEGTPFRSPDLFVEGAEAGLPAAPQVHLSNHGHRAALEVELPPAGAAKDPLRLTVVDGSRAAEFMAAPVISTGDDDHGIVVILALALLGGLILNFMPCVLPVLSIKVFSVAKAAGTERKTARRVALATALGIVTSFGLLAAVLSILKLAGASLGWGIQFQQPWFLAGMAVVTTLFAASFFDWLPIGLPPILSGGASGATNRGPLVEAFVGGMLSTLLATPCSAPLVGTVVGFALARSPVEITAVLLALGVGMALPFLTLALAPSLATRLPRPGQWMIQLRKIMGLLLLTTSVWLIASLWNIAGMAVASLVSIVLIAMLAVRAVVTRLASLRTNRWSGATTALLACCAIAIASLTPSGAGDRSAPPSEWQAFDPNAISTLVASGKTVLVDVTASWCLTCKVNELSVLDTAAVRTRLRQDNIVRMRADWSRYNPGVLAYIQGFGRFGIPLDVVYGPRMPQGQLLPEVLQTSTLFRALDNATPPQTAKSNSSAGWHGTISSDDAHSFR
ncbi:protein-disulfide reductase DsbD family protein [Paraburkholderia phenazinium]|uniref:Suppressor for copper-sensitivity B n=2 Tax=Paraburkholderia phenazinium TaxID=60549 RepID=A0A1G7RUN4_9BURK|nr:protein-disulfide reductase DsbD domain-containing protein [Paraburkholderia phenazinium]SDG14456.1 suppressor for copper-sensitivity B [Paraburkholderia phenazinium]